MLLSTHCTILVLLSVTLVLHQDSFTLSGKSNVTGSNFEITFISEKHVVEDDVLFTNHLVGK